jgi:hypothetical protein
MQSRRRPDGLSRGADSEAALGHAAAAAGAGAGLPPTGKSEPADGCAGSTRRSVEYGLESGQGQVLPQEEARGDPAWSSRMACPTLRAAATHHCPFQ